QLLDDCIRALLPGGCNIEDIARHNIGPSIKNLLGCNLRDCFQLNNLTLNLALCRRRGSQSARYDEVNLTNTEDQFQRTNSIAYIAIRPNFKFEILFLGIKKRKLLRVVEENVDIMAFAMIDLQHHRCAAP